MKIFFTLIIIIQIQSTAHAAAECICKCVTKTAENEYSTETGHGKDREAAGENLKKNLGKKKCELSPDCKGSC